MELHTASFSSEGSSGPASLLSFCSKLRTCSGPLQAPGVRQALWCLLLQHDHQPSSPQAHWLLVETPCLRAGMAGAVLIERERESVFLSYCSVIVLHENHFCSLHTDVL